MNSNTWNCHTWISIHLKYHLPVCMINIIVFTQIITILVVFFNIICSNTCVYVLYTKTDECAILRLWECCMKISIVQMHTVHCFMHILFQNNVINYRCSTVFTVSTIYMSTTAVIYLCIRSAACSSYTCYGRDSYISSVWVHKWVWMLDYFTLVSLLFLAISILLH